MIGKVEGNNEVKGVLFLNDKAEEGVLGVKEIILEADLHIYTLLIKEKIDDRESKEVLNKEIRVVDLLLLVINILIVSILVISCIVVVVVFF